VRGIHYEHAFKDELKDFLETNKCMKIVSQGLLNSDPRFFDRIIYMIRHPREVAKSQEDLQRQFGNATKDGEEQKVHSAEMYIKVTAMAAQFFLDYPEIPVLFCQHSDMIANPEKHIKSVAKFLDLPQKESWLKAKDVIEARLKRSNPQPIESALWEAAEEIYRLFNEGDFKAVVDYYEADGVEALKQENAQWFCPRLNGPTNKNKCHLCITSADTRKNYKMTADRKKADWQNEPCLYECGFDTSRDKKDLKTIKESIDKNFWYDPQEKPPKITEKS
jgi:hypothetical protein